MMTLSLKKNVPCTLAQRGRFSEENDKQTEIIVNLSPQIFYSLFITREKTLCTRIVQQKSKVYRRGSTPDKYNNRYEPHL